MTATAHAGRESTPRSRWVESTDGLAVHVTDWGGRGMPCLLLHGFSHHGRVWDDFSEALLDAGFRPLALDFRGHGRSQWDPEARYSPLALRDDLASVVRVLDGEPFCLVGHSLGGYVAAQYASSCARSGLRALVLVEFGPRLKERGVRRIALDDARLDVAYTNDLEYARALKLVHPLAQARVLERLARFGLRRKDDGTLRRAKDPRFGRPIADRRDDDREAATDLWTVFARITVPTLLVRGSISSVLSQQVAARAVDDVLIDGRLVVIPAGHGAHLDDPNAFCKATLPFLQGARGA